MPFGWKCRAYPVDGGWVAPQSLSVADGGQPTAGCPWKREAAAQRRTEDIRHAASLGRGLIPGTASASIMSEFPPPRGDGDSLLSLSRAPGRAPANLPHSRAVLATAGPIS